MRMKNRYATYFANKKISSQWPPWIKSVSWGEKINAQLPRQEKIDAQQVPRTTKISTQQVPGTKNQHAKIPMSKISFIRRKNQFTRFTKRKINLQHVDEQKSSYNKFCQISTQAVPRAKLVSRGEKLMRNFHKEKNQYATSF